MTNTPAPSPMSRRLFWKLATPFVRTAHWFGLCSYEWVNVTIGAWHPELFDALWQYERYGAPIDALPEWLTLGGIGYRVAASEGTIVFTADDHFDSRIVLERDHHARQALWYATLRGRVPAPHFSAAYRWTKAVFGDSHEWRASASQEKAP